MKPKVTDFSQLDLYQENGVKEYWLANPEGKSIQIFYLDKHVYVELETFIEKEETVYSKFFPEFSFAMTSIFEY